MSEVIKYRGTTSASNTTGVTEVTATNPLPVSIGGSSGNVLVAGKYNATPGTGVDGTQYDLQLDSSKNLRVAEQFAPNYEEQTVNRALTLSAPVTSTTYNLSIDKSAALEASSVTKATAGNLYWVSGRIDSTAPTATYYYQILSAASLPSDGAVTYLVAPMKLQHTTGTDTPIAIGNPSNAVTPIAGSATGLVECLSSTEFTKTITAAYLSTTVGYL